MKNGKSFGDLEVWFITGSQHLYGPKTLAQVAENSSRLQTRAHDA